MPSVPFTHTLHVENYSSSILQPPPSPNVIRDISSSSGHSPSSSPQSSLHTSTEVTRLREEVTRLRQSLDAHESRAPVSVQHALLPVLLSELTDQVCLGVGSYGAVYRAMFRGEEVAVKRIARIEERSSSSISPERMHGLEAEAAILAKIRHPHIVQILALATDPQTDERAIVL